MTEPSRQEQLRPVELLVMTAIMSLFIGFIVWFTTKDWLLALIFTGVGFILGIMTLSLLLLAIAPKKTKSSNSTNESTNHETDSNR